MTPAQTNAAVLKVTRGGFSEEPGASVEAGAGAAAFEGSTRIYYREKRERVTSGQGRDVIVRRTLIVDTRDPAIDWLEGDVVEFLTDGDAAAQTGKVQEVVEARHAPHAGTGTETTRVELEPK